MKILFQMKIFLFWVKSLNLILIKFFDNVLYLAPTLHFNFLAYTVYQL